MSTPARRENQTYDMDKLRQLSSQSEQTFLDLINSVEGIDVLKGRTVVEKAELIKVPFVITAVRFQKGSKGFNVDFVTCEVTTASDLEAVINDGSTGIRRQMVSYLQHRGLIDVGPAGEHPATEHFDRGEWDEPLDKPYEMWDKGADDARDGITLLPKPLVCVNGLRVSEYIHPEYGEAITYYLA